MTSLIQMIHLKLLSVKCDFILFDKKIRILRDRYYILEYT